MKIRKKHWLVLLVLAACAEPERRDTLFQQLDAKMTGITFRNDLAYDDAFNVYTYRNYYNGGGVAIGDINQDGLPDVYLTANLTANQLYLNQGNFQFRDITESAGVAGTRAWSTGVTIVDVNGDGLLDIYVCNSGDVAGDNKQNELFINNGDLTFTERAADYGLADPGYSTHASFFDYDRDGDLDVYLLNNSYQAIGSFNLKRNERPKRDSLGGDKLMRNDGGLFVDVSEAAGIYGSIIGFGLGVTVGDVNGDGWEDIYVSNDFFERDYLYINQRNGTFKETLTEQMKSISAASMGADMADVNNDGWNDLFVTEMLPADPQRLRTITTFEDWNRYQYNLENGYYHQFTRNTFQLNNANSTFSEIGRLAGVQASDWSWGALIFDMENDGLRDLFIANGIYQDLTNQDYLQYISNEEVVKSIVQQNKVNYKKLIDLIPSTPVPNQAYRNRGNLHFELLPDYGLDTEGFSNGAAYGDLDNDGDLDLIVNNVNGACLVYRNQTTEKGMGHFLGLALKGVSPNSYGIGAIIRVKQGETLHYVEQQPVRGFQSSMDPRPLVGLADTTPVLVEITWPSGKVQTLQNVAVDDWVILKEEDAAAIATSGVAAPQRLFRRVQLDLPRHQENEFNDFDRDRLLYHMVSTEGPRMAATDLNGDARPDFFIGSAKDETPFILQSSGADFQVLPNEVFEADRVSEDGASVFFDADGDGDADLYVCSGGVEFSRSSSALWDRLYFNDGEGQWRKSTQTLPALGGYMSSSTVSAADVDGDGDLDLFVGERVKPFAYGQACSGYLLFNNGQGEFTEVSAERAPDLAGLGMITTSAFTDFNADGWPDLVVAGEYMGVRIFQNQSGKLEPLTVPGMSDQLGWWKTIHVADVNADGLPDIVAGNHGLNSRFKASQERPIHLYVADFDNNGFVDPILAARESDGKDYPFALRHNLIDQIKELKKKFPDYESYRTASIDEIFTTEELKRASKLPVTQLATTLWVNQGNFNFQKITLPVEAQLSEVYAITSGDFDKDGDMDLLMGGNLYATKPEVGRYDASFGIWLENLGNLQFKGHNGQHGFLVDGEIRDMKVIGNRIFVTRNGDAMMVFEY